MVLHCSVLGCKNTNEIYLKLSFFKYPKDPERLKKWVSATRIRTLSRWSVACSDHFAEEDYYPPYTINGRRRLRETAVPSIKLPEKTTENENNCEIDVVEGGENRRKNWEEEMLYLSDDNNYDEEEHEEEEEDEEAEHSTTLLILELDKTPLDCNDGASMNEELIRNESEMGIPSLDLQQGTTCEKKAFRFKNNKLSVSLTGVDILTRGQCVFCLKDFLTPFALNIHIRRKHDQEEIPSQSEIYTRYAELIANESESAIQPLNDQQGTLIEEKSVTLEGNKLSGSTTGVQNIKKRHVCKYCQKDFPRSWTLRRHIKRHDEEKPFQCETCNKRFFLESKLVAHMKTHTETFECEECNKVFLRKHSLIKHMNEKDVHNRKDGKRRFFQCNICSKSFLQKANLVCHMRSHTGEKPFQCEVCGMVFARRNALERHKGSNHLLNRPQCQICSKIFRSRYELSQHAMMHTDETPHKCTFCEKAFKLKSGLDKHKWRHIGKPYCCDICQKSFTSEAYKDYHVRMHSGETV